MKPQVQEGNFHQVIQKVITEGRHSDYLKKVLEDYDDYRKTFEKAFISTTPKPQILLFRAEYKWIRSLWREIEIRSSQTFIELAIAIIESMGWDNDHMHAFYLPTEETTQHPYFISPYGFYAPYWEDDPYPTFKTDEIEIGNLNFKKYPKLKFIFDFGDDHQFSVKFKKARKSSKKEISSVFPRLTDQRGVAQEQYPDHNEENV